jgi:hypothetical protein
VIICLVPPLPAASSDLPESLTKRAASPLLFGLSPGGVYRATAVAGDTGELLPRRFTLAPGFPGAVYSLWHFPWGHPHWALPSTLPCGARTFLGARAPRSPHLLRRRRRKERTNVQWQYTTRPGDSKALPENQESTTELRARFARRSASPFSSRGTCSNRHRSNVFASRETSSASARSSGLRVRY